MVYYACKKISHFRAADGSIAVFTPPPPLLPSSL